MKKARPNVQNSVRYGRGFTLIETLVAISILLIALAGPLTIAAKGLNSSYYARDQITAFYLAQEGIEYIRNYRDTDSLSRGPLAPGEEWLSPLVTAVNGTVTGSLKFTIDAKYSPTLSGGSINPIGIFTCSGGVCPSLKLNPTGTYGYGVGDPDTQFIREMTLTKITDSAYRITSKVSWRSPLPNSSFTLVEDITNWQQ